MNSRDEEGSSQVESTQQDSCKGCREPVAVTCLAQRRPLGRQYLGGVIYVPFLGQAEAHILVHFYVNLLSSVGHPG